ncbi:lipid A export permease/ATP-binding protein MsbA [Francisella tularensis subsp. novicida]|uniref:Lipid A export permease/ATP-binding protein MsbA n=3 Tax=Gammaproteobacteria TaxID=1236 RepID=A0A6I4RPJ1_FRATU|nr:lipid A export permease/ATP-binding protein MsbA [Francisella tularensis]ABK90466.1 lipid exporter (LipidE) family protein [Francisella tularensis subsp. novicida U112]AJI60480.1 lipid A export permease/ATP-binding protein MsbA [Francisella tularensis subsp. novicida U112]APA83774.1 Lipid A export ATP-binding/permease protein MsbA [Francisella tularensis subsp. novicida PA10-7858]EDX18893.1 lipid A export ATP-binding/permease MsbA [Francisella tularensis subsp. novicida FTE]EDZ90138.1 lipid
MANMIDKIDLKSQGSSNLSGEMTNHQKVGTLYKRLLLQVKHLWHFLLLAAIGSIFFSAADASMIYLINPILNYGFGPGGGITKQSATILMLMGVGMVGLLALRSVGSFVSQYFIGSLGQKVVYKFRKDIYKRLMDLPASFFDKHSTGQIISRLLYNVDQVTEATSTAIITVVQDGTFVIGLIVVMFVSSWQLSLFLIVVGPFLGLFISIINKKFRNLSRNTQSSMGNVTHTAEETIRNYKEIRIFGAQQKQQNKFFKNLDYTYSQQIRTIALDALTSPVIQIIASLVLAFSLFTIAIFGTNDGGGSSWLTAGSFASFFAAAAAILKPIKNLTKVNVVIQKAVAATEDIFYILDYPAEKETGSKELAKVDGNVTIKDLSFAFGEHKVLSGVSVDIKAGQTVAFVGKSGSGKTTLTSIISRFYTQHKGEILLDGVDTRELTLENLRSHLSIVSQNVHLFDDTVYNNIAFGLSREVSEDEVIDALKRANAYEFVQELSDGIHTNIGNNGSKLSGGQRQRISIARALLKNAPVLIFDEATSALDNESERVVQQALESLTESCTTIVIAHRLSTVENADKIVVMDGGKVVESGKHQELLEQGGLYTRLYQSGLQ